MQQTLELRGVRVVSLAEGSHLGRLCTVYFDPNNNRVSALGVRTRWVGGHEFSVSTADVLNVRDDVIVISSERAAHPLSEEAPVGPSLAELLGGRVTTVNGHHLGRLADLVFSRDWTITELALDDRQRLSVTSDEIRLGEEIIVPEHCADDVALQGDLVPTFMRSMFGAAPSHLHVEQGRSERREQGQDEGQAQET